MVDRTGDWSMDDAQSAICDLMLMNLWLTRSVAQSREASSGNPVIFNAAGRAAETVTFDTSALDGFMAKMQGLLAILAREVPHGEPYDRAVALIEAAGSLPATHGTLKTRTMRWDCSMH